MAARSPITNDLGDDVFAFAAQSNFSGVKHPLDLIDQAQQLGWDVLLDCAACSDIAYRSVRDLA